MTQSTWVFSAVCFAAIVFARAASQARSRSRDAAKGDAYSKRAPPPTVFIWSHPRALSTALLRSLAEHSLMTTVLEPFMVPWQLELGVYRGPSNSPPDFEKAMAGLLSDKYVDANPGRTLHGCANVQKPNLQVVKDMPCHGGMDLLHRITTAFPSAKHVFLVRHPYRTIPSYFRIAVSYSDEVMRADISYKGLLEYAEHLTALKNAFLSETTSTQARKRAAFFFMDADSLIRNPKPALEQLCQYIGVKYEPTLLRWEKNVPPASWGDIADFEDWLDEVLSSSGWKLKPDLPEHPSIPTGGRPFQTELIEENMPVYDKLRMLAQDPTDLCGE